MELRGVAETYGVIRDNNSLPPSSAGSMPTFLPPSLFISVPPSLPPPLAASLSLHFSEYFAPSLPCPLAPARPSQVRLYARRPSSAGRGLLACLLAGPTHPPPPFLLAFLAAEQLASPFLIPTFKFPVSRLLLRTNGSVPRSLSLWPHSLGAPNHRPIRPSSVPIFVVVLQSFLLSSVRLFSVCSCSFARSQSYNRPPPIHRPSLPPSLPPLSLCL